MVAPVINILAIESSCDDTAASVVQNGNILCNIVATQQVHEAWGGVVPELASRAHQQNIVPLVDLALKKSGIKPGELSAIAFTAGPGLIGSLLVGSSFAKSMALGLNIPIIEVNHMQAHILAHFIPGGNDRGFPAFPFICLTVSGGHTTITRVDDHFQTTVIGTTTDDAAGEAFDKAAKMLGLPYPGGIFIDRHASKGDPLRFVFPQPQIPGYDYSFSGLKTAYLYFVKKMESEQPGFVQNNMDDICASIQFSIIRHLMKKLIQVSLDTGIREIAIAGGVSANSGLRQALADEAARSHWNIYIPKTEYCTDNAAMIAITAYHKFRHGLFADQSVSAYPR